MLARRHTLLLVVVVTLAEAAHLFWEQGHGGIRAHHLLNNPDLPAISNAWGMLLLPLLAWAAAKDIARRGVSVRWAAAGVVAAAAIGLAVVALFLTHQDSLAGDLLLAVIVLGCVLPLYRPHLLLGFVLAMTWTFGAVLPTLIGLAIAAISAVANGLWRLLRAYWRR